MNTRMLRVMGTCVVVASACGVPLDDQPVAVEVPRAVFDQEQGVTEGDVELGEPNVTLHPLYFLRDGELIEVSRPLPSPVLLRVPMENLVAGPTALEVSSGLESEIPAGTEIVDVSLDGSNIVSIRLNDAFFEVEGERRINATAQLVFTGYGLARDTQGVRFFFADGRPAALPAGDGTIAEVADGDPGPVLRTADYADLVPQAEPAPTLSEVIESS